MAVHMNEMMFSQRLVQLRTQMGVSARDMSLSIGQNPGYINTIENAKALPSMNNFFYICDFLHISPKDFFDTESESPEKIKKLTALLRHLNTEQLEALMVIVESMTNKK